jgi:POT family proton-dependent oligopeptide transporter
VILRATIGLVAALAILAVLLGALRMPLEALQQWVNWALVVLPLAYFVYMLRQPGRPVVERHRLTAMFVLFLATSLWFAVVSQAGSTLNVFAEYDTQRAMLGFTVPAPWFQSINPVAILLFAPPLAWLWTHLGTRQPPTPVKFATALFLVAGSMAMMVVASRFAPLSGEATVLVSPLWLFGVFVVQTLGELLISPIGLSVATRLAPPAQTSQLMGVWFLGLAVGAALSGELAGLYGTVGVAAYYALLALLMVATGAAIAILTPWLLREMEGVR